AVRREGGVQIHITGRNDSIAEEDRLRQGTSRAVGRLRTLLYGERGGQKQQAQAHNLLAHISHALVFHYCIGITALVIGNRRLSVCERKYGATPIPRLKPCYVLETATT